MSHGIRFALDEIEAAIERANPFDDVDDDPAEFSPNETALYEVLGRFRALVRTVRIELAGGAR